MKENRILWYAADPMCSWCWGFSPVISAIRDKFGGKIKISLLLGGLQPGTTVPMSVSSRDEILHHWHDVHERTGQPFMFEGAMPEGFIYDTEPPSRAVLALAETLPEQTFRFFTTLQEAFYVKQMDITRENILVDLLADYDIKPDVFRESFESDEIKQKTQAHFSRARQAGIRGFPTCVLQDETNHQLLCSGYRSYEELQPEIENWLA